MSNTKNPPIGLFASMYDRYITFLRHATHEARMRYAIVSLVIAVVLTVFASLAFLNMPNFVYVAAAVPAAIIFFLNFSALAYFTRVSDWELVNYKSEHSFRRRLRDVAIAIAVFIVLLLVIGAYLAIPYGLGGALVIFVALVAYNVTRRTQSELRLAAAGLPDPRDIPADTKVGEEE